jgi:hypothetical protein
MNREWLTLGFGILLVTAVAVVSVWQNYPGLAPGRPAPAAAGQTAAKTAEENVPAPPAALDLTPSTPATAPKPASPSQPATSQPAKTDAAVTVVHKHRFGDCEGTLRALPGTLTYTTTNKEDGFRLAFAEVETFDLNEEGTTLRIRRRGGRTWNFTPKGTAATLAAFHKEASRTRR